MAIDKLPGLTGINMGPGRHSWEFWQRDDENDSMLYRCRHGCDKILRLTSIWSGDIDKDEHDQGISSQCPKCPAAEPVLAKEQGPDRSEPDPDRLKVARLRRNSLNTYLGPADLLRAVAAEIESGEFIADGLVVIAKHTPQDGPHEHKTFSSMVTLPELMLMLDLAKRRSIREYVTGETGV